MKKICVYYELYSPKRSEEIGECELLDQLEFFRK